jgi:rfaE bifunctional protein kinase chain/domain
MTTREILDQFPALSVLVIGDICLDRWCDYDPHEADPSRETGIPRTAVVSSVVTPGAGGTVAANVAALGAGRVAVLGTTGDDGHGWELRRALECRGIETGLLVTNPGSQTFTYTKLINRSSGVEDKARIDFINTQPTAKDVEARIRELVSDSVGSFDVVLISDQAETETGGVVSAAVRNLLAGLSGEFPEKVFWVDSRRRSELFRNVIVKPNEDEAREACRRLGERVDYGGLHREIGGPALLVTHGADGVLVVDDSGERWVRTRVVAEPVDICGAGDSFSAAAAMAMKVTGSAQEAARLGNLAASVTIMQRGTGTASAEEILVAGSETP